MKHASRSNRQLATRRRFLKSTAAVGLLAGLDGLLPSYVAEGTPRSGTWTAGEPIDLFVESINLDIAGRNPGSLHGP